MIMYLQNLYVLLLTVIAVIMQGLLNVIDW